MTATTEAIVTALGTGPASARDLSQRLDGIGYASIRQTLGRLTKAGVVTKLRRGIYALDCDTSKDHGYDTCSGPVTPANRPAIVPPADRARPEANELLNEPAREDHDRSNQSDERPRPPSPCARTLSDTGMSRQHADALAKVWTDFEAQNDPRDPRAWA